MCCGAALWEPAEEEIRGWVAAGFILEEAAPDEASEEPGAWRAVMRDPAAFSFAFKADETLLRKIFGREIAASGRRRRHGGGGSSDERGE